MSNSTDAGNHCIIIVADLFAKINAQRKLLHRPPVENQAMASRCTLRFNIDSKRGVDFSNDIVLVAPDEIDNLEKIVNELFGVYFTGEIRRLCAKPTITEPDPVEIDPLPPLSPEVTSEPVKTGLLSRLKGFFGGR